MTLILVHHHVRVRGRQERIRNQDFQVTERARNDMCTISIKCGYIFSIFTWKCGCRCECGPNARCHNNKSANTATSSRLAECDDTIAESRCPRGGIAAGPKMGWTRRAIERIGQQNTPRYLARTVDISCGQNQMRRNAQQPLVYSLSRFFPMRTSFSFFG